MPKLSQPGREMAENSLIDLAPSLPVCEIAAPSWVELVGTQFVQCGLNPGRDTATRGLFTNPDKTSRLLPSGPLV